MTFQELKEKHRKELNDFMNECKRSMEVMYEEKIELRRAYNFMADKMPKSIQRLIEQRHKEWQKEWGVEGWRTKQLKEQQERETKKFFSRERVMKDIIFSKKRDQENDGGR